MLAIEVVFLTGRYVATAHNTRSSGEWPPHPARLFSAMVSAHHADPDPDPDERAMLQVLEALGAPAIAASDASRRDVVTHFVPVNDVATTNVDEEAARRDEAEALVAAAVATGDSREEKKARTQLDKAQARLAKAIQRATALPDRLVDPEYGRRVLPDHRGRQPRTMPSVTPEDPRVVYMWPGWSPEQRQVDRLASLLRRVTRLGHSASLVALRLVDDPPEPAWQPSADGELVLRVVEAGQLAALEQAHARHLEVEPRVLPARTQPYSRMTSETRRSEERALFSEDWLVLRRIGGPVIPMTASAGIAKALRRTLMSFADQPVPEVLSGHLSDGSPGDRMHLAVIPLPFVGHPRATGTVLGVALVLPRDAEEETKKAVFATLRRWEDEHRLEDEEVPSVPLNLGPAGALRLQRVEWDSVPSTLQASRWCGPAVAWSSVTPVALDRNPGQLRSRDSQELRAALTAAESIVRTSCERIGLPNVGRVEILPAAPWAGAVKARQYPRFPQEDSRTQRVLTHVRIEFERAVRGPVIIGVKRQEKVTPIRH